VYSRGSPTSCSLILLICLRVEMRARRALFSIPTILLGSWRTTKGLSLTYLHHAARIERAVARIIDTTARSGSSCEQGGLWHFSVRKHVRCRVFVAVYLVTRANGCYFVPLFKQ